MVVPKGVELSDLDMEMKVDEKEHSPDIKKQEKASDNETDKSGKKSLRQMLVNVFIIILLLLILLFIVRLVQYQKKVEEKTQAQQGSKEAQAGSARSEAEKIKKCLTNQGNFYYNISCIKKKTMTKTVRYVRKFQRAGDGERPV